MADDLKRSVENLESPDCPHCRKKMKWYRAVRLEGEPVVIEHYFQCSHCDRMEITRTTGSGKQLPPRHKLSRPAQRSAA
jgi:hypothetical protein